MRFRPGLIPLHAFERKQQHRQTIYIYEPSDERQHYGPKAAQFAGPHRHCAAHWSTSNGWSVQQGDFLPEGLPIRGDGQMVSQPSKRAVVHESPNRVCHLRFCFRWRYSMLYIYHDTAGDVCSDDPTVIVLRHRSLADRLERMYHNPLNRQRVQGYVLCLTPIPSALWCLLLHFYRGPLHGRQAHLKPRSQLPRLPQIRARHQALPPMHQPAIIQSCQLSSSRSTDTLSTFLRYFGTGSRHSSPSRLGFGHPFYLFSIQHYM
jgi:hypothetical protein